MSFDFSHFSAATDDASAPDGAAGAVSPAVAVAEANRPALLADTAKYRAELDAERQLRLADVPNTNPRRSEPPQAPAAAASVSTPVPASAAASAAATTAAALHPGSAWFAQHMRDQLASWSEADVSMYDSAVLIHGQNLSAIHKLLPHKSRSELREYQNFRSAAAQEYLSAVPPPHPTNAASAAAAASTATTAATAATAAAAASAAPSTTATTSGGFGLTLRETAAAQKKDADQLIHQRDAADPTKPANVSAPAPPALEFFTDLESAERRLHALRLHQRKHWQRTIDAMHASKPDDDRKRRGGGDDDPSNFNIENNFNDGRANPFAPVPRAGEDGMLENWAARSQYVHYILLYDTSVDAYVVEAGTMPIWEEIGAFRKRKDELDGRKKAPDATGVEFKFTGRDDFPDQVIILPNKLPLPLPPALDESKPADCSTSGGSASSTLPPPVHRYFRSWSSAKAYSDAVNGGWVFVQQSDGDFMHWRRDAPLYRCIPNARHLRVSRSRQRILDNEQRNVGPEATLVHRIGDVMHLEPRTATCRTLGLQRTLIGAVYDSVALGTEVAWFEPPAIPDELGGEFGSAVSKSGQSANSDELGMSLDVATGCYFMKPRLRSQVPAASAGTAASNAVRTSYLDDSASIEVFLPPPVSIENGAVVYYDVAKPGSEQVPVTTFSGVPGEPGYVNACSPGGVESDIAKLAKTMDLPESKGLPARSRYENPIALALSHDKRTLFVADQSNSCVRALDLPTKQVTMVEGSGHAREESVGAGGMFKADGNGAADGSLAAAQDAIDFVYGVCTGMALETDEALATRKRLGFPGGDWPLLQEVIYTVKSNRVMVVADGVERSVLTASTSAINVSGIVATREFLYVTEMQTSGLLRINLATRKLNVILEGRDRIIEPRGMRFARPELCVIPNSILFIAGTGGLYRYLVPYGVAQILEHFIAPSGVMEAEESRLLPELWKLIASYLDVFQSLKRRTGQYWTETGIEECCHPLFLQDSELGLIAVDQTPSGMLVCTTCDNGLVMIVPDDEATGGGAGSNQVESDEELDVDESKTAVGTGPMFTGGGSVGVADTRTELEIRLAASGSSATPFALTADDAKAAARLAAAGWGKGRRDKLGAWAAKYSRAASMSGRDPITSNQGTISAAATGGEESCPSHGAPSLDSLIRMTRPRGFASSSGLHPGMVINVSPLKKVHRGAKFSRQFRDGGYGDATFSGMKGVVVFADSEKGTIACLVADLNNHCIRRVELPAELAAPPQRLRRCLPEPLEFWSRSADHRTRLYVNPLDVVAQSGANSAFLPDDAAQTRLLSESLAAGMDDALKRQAARFGSIQAHRRTHDPSVGGFGSMAAPRLTPEDAKVLRTLQESEYAAHEARANATDGGVDPVLSFTTSSFQDAFAFGSTPAAESASAQPVPVPAPIVGLDNRSTAPRSAPAATKVVPMHPPAIAASAASEPAAASEEEDWTTTTLDPKPKPPPLTSTTGEWGVYDGLTQFSDPRAPIVGLTDPTIARINRNGVLVKRETVTATATAAAAAAAPAAAASTAKKETVAVGANVIPGSDPLPTSGPVVVTDILTNKPRQLASWEVDSMVPRPGAVSDAPVDRTIKAEDVEAAAAALFGGSSAAPDPNPRSTRNGWLGGGTISELARMTQIPQLSTDYFANSTATAAGAGADGAAPPGGVPTSTAANEPTATASTAATAAAATLDSAAPDKPLPAGLLTAIFNSAATGAPRKGKKTQQAEFHPSDLFRSGSSLTPNTLTVSDVFGPKSKPRQLASWEVDSQVPRPGGTSDAPVDNSVKPEDLEAAGAALFGPIPATVATAAPTTTAAAAPASLTTTATAEAASLLTQPTGPLVFDLGPNPPGLFGPAPTPATEAQSQTRPEFNFSGFGAASAETSASHIGPPDTDADATTSGTASSTTTQSVLAGEGHAVAASAAQVGKPVFNFDADSANFDVSAAFNTDISNYVISGLPAEFGSPTVGSVLGANAFGAPNAVGTADGTTASATASAASDQAMGSWESSAAFNFGGSAPAANFGGGAMFGGGGAGAGAGGGGGGGGSTTGRRVVVARRKGK